MRRCSTDELEIYRRGVENAPRPACCPAPFDVDNNWMTEYPRAYVIPRGAGQRSAPEATRLAQWLLDNQIVVEELKQDTTFEGQTFEQGSYVVWMTQARRGLADTALSIGVDVSSRISILYAPPAAWSHGYLWGASVVTIPRGAAFSPETNRRSRSRASSAAAGSIRARPTATRSSSTHRQPCGRSTACSAAGVSAQLALASFTTADGATLPAGSAIFAGDSDTKTTLAATVRDAELRVATRPDREPAVARAGRAGAADRGARRRGRPEHLDAPEPRLHGRSGLGRHDQLGARRTRCSSTTSSTTPATGPARPTRWRGRG